MRISDWSSDVCSSDLNDYLGLSQQFAVVNALQDVAAREGVGSTASHLVCGHHAVHDELERELAEWVGAPRALLLGSGFRSVEHTYELQSLMRISYDVFCLKKNNLTLSYIKHHHTH